MTKHDPKTDKRRLYELINLYLSGEVDAVAFCNEFYSSYDLEVDFDSLSEDEYEAFRELSEVACRFSEFKHDIANFPGIYYSKEQLTEKITETKNKLKNLFDTYNLQD